MFGIDSKLKQLANQTCYIVDIADKSPETRKVEVGDVFWGVLLFEPIVRNIDEPYVKRIKVMIVCT